MIYFDYSATTFPDKIVIKEFVDSSKKYIGNPNSSHKLGLLAKDRIDIATKSIANIFNVLPSEIIYTSGSTESNNLAIKGVCLANKGNHIITTNFEHSSVNAPINRLTKEGYNVSFVNCNKDGTIDINHLESLINDDTVLVSIVGVDSELGIKQDIEKIGKILKKYPNVYFHVDATQMIGKVKINFENVDLVSFSAHKFYGIKGIGCLIKKDNVRIMPQLDGGHSTTKYRSGTPYLELICSMQKALELIDKDLDDKIKCVNILSNNLKIFLNGFKEVHINNTEKSIPNMVNFSINNSDNLLKKLNEKEIYVSSKSACSISNISNTIYRLYNDENIASNSIRISLSYKTTMKELEVFKKVFKEFYEENTYENN